MSRYLPSRCSRTWKRAALFDASAYKRWLGLSSLLHYGSLFPVTCKVTEIAMTPKQAAMMYQRTSSIRHIMRSARCDFYTAKDLIQRGGGRLLGRLRRSRLSDTELLEAYLTKSVSGVAKLNGTSHVVVIRRLHRLGAVMRSRGNNAVSPRVFKHGFAARAIELGIGVGRYLRMLAILTLGGLCKCGEDDIRVLEINHINGRGKPGSTKARYAECLAVLRGEPSSYLEVCCANCNVLHEYERGNRPVIPVAIIEAIRAADWAFLRQPVKECL